MTISYNRRIELISLGYYVEDMAEVWGSEFVGQYRWMNEITDEFQDCDTSCSIDEAWILADADAATANMVQDRKTGEFYNPQERFDQLMNKPETLAMLKRLAVR
jgi:hypothetical protein